ncbi:tetratricopeptide repeat-containing hybrid sensor histidine kinase/response regulator [Williamwhitmania taraxaci]|uniref:histidine kinase n=1 Tax=Williamwhitmania taraxaci TaxID=1640674 RepID=A0A1G6GZN4_9BACT|nr:tetratricopeptide repeat protein [Williamwhitmania taraxaci]SDB87507.1 Signal transduction histidine kinase [Williamwhitmania taraxaci]
MKLFRCFFVGFVFYFGCAWSIQGKELSVSDSAPDTVKAIYQKLTGKPRLLQLLELSKQTLQNNPRLSKQLSSQAISLALELGAKEEQGYANLYFGNASFFLGDYFNAQESLSRSLSIAQGLGNQRLLVDVYDAFGTVYTSTGDFQKALKYFKSAFQIILQIDFPEERSSIIRKIGNIYFQFGDNQKALDFYLVALETSRKGNDQEGVSMAYNNIGRIFTEQGKYTEALDYFDKALKIKKHVGSEISISNTLLNIGRTYEKMAKFGLAEKYYLEVLKTRSRLENPEGVASAQQYLSRVYLQSARAPLGERLLKKSIHLADSFGLDGLKVSGYQQLAEYYTRSNRYKEALDALLSYNKAKDSVYSNEKRRFLVEVDSRYKFESSEYRIKMLSKEAALKASELKEARWVGYFWAILFLCFVLVSYLLFHNYQLKSSINKKLVLEIEERKKAQLELVRYQIDLERIVDDRTAQLKEAKDCAEQSDRLKSSFLANISHEVRTPMNAIVGFTSFLLEPSLDKKSQTEALSQIKVNGDILLSLLNDILDISLIEVDQLKIVNGYFNIERSIEEVVSQKQSISSQWLKPGVELKFTPDTQFEGMLFADESRFRQILGNLLSNALKFTDQGYIEIGYRVEQLMVVFFVRDTGIGVPRGNQRAIFDRFSKFNASEDRFYSGTGIGLSLCKDIVGLMDGNIWVDSTPGNGSTFYFSLPFTEEMSGSSKQMKGEKKMGGLGLDFSGKTILVAEDVESNFLLVNALLKSSGARILWAKDGLEAIDFSVKDEINLVLMDIRMPKLDGVDATKKIKEMFPNLPIVILTAFSHQEEMNRCYDAGCSAYLLKPIKKAELYSVVARLLL